MKKSYILVISLISISILLANLIPAQDQQPPGLLPIINPDEAGDTIENIKNKTQTYLDRWDEFSDNLKSSLLNNKYISGLNWFFTKISIIFRILFGQSYSFSLSLFLVIILWFCIFFILRSIIKNYSAFSNMTSYLISFGTAGICAQLQIFRIIAEKIIAFFVWLIFSEKTLIQKIAIFGIIILSIVLVIALIIRWNKFMKEQKEKQEKTKAETARKTIIKTAEGIKEGLKK